jgi:hypothetical protein
MRKKEPEFVDDLNRYSYNRWKAKRPGLYIERDLASASERERAKKFDKYLGVNTEGQYGTEGGGWCLVLYHEQGYSTIFCGTKAECQRKKQEQV